MKKEIENKTEAEQNKRAKSEPLNYWKETLLLLRNLTERD